MTTDHDALDRFYDAYEFNADDGLAAYTCRHCAGRCAPWENNCSECGCAQDWYEQERENTRRD